MQTFVFLPVLRHGAVGGLLGEASILNRGLMPLRLSNYTVRTSTNRYVKILSAVKECTVSNGNSNLTIIRLSSIAITAYGQAPSCYIMTLCNDKAILCKQEGSKAQNESIRVFKHIRTSGQCDYYVQLYGAGTVHLYVEYSMSNADYSIPAKELIASLPSGVEEVALSQ